MFKNDPGPVTHISEAHGHWENAGDLGIVCERHKDPGNTSTIYVYQKNASGTFEKFLDYQINPQSCDVFTSDLQAIWVNLGTIIEDTKFVPEHRDGKDTLRRWKIQ